MTLKGGGILKDISEKCIMIGGPFTDDDIEVSVSRIKRWKHCPMSHDYKYVHKLITKQKAVPLTMGSWVHSCLEVRDLGLDWLAKLKEMKTTEYDNMFQEEKVMLGDLPGNVFRIMRAYNQTYLYVDAEWETMSCEQDFMIRIGNTNIILVGKIDKIARHKLSGQVWCWEHKTMKKSIPTEQFRITDVQTAVYIWVMKVIASHLNFDKNQIGGVMFDYIRTKPPTKPRLLKNGTMSKAKIDCDRWTYMAELKKNNLDVKDYEDFIKKLDENVFFVRIPMAKSTTMMELVMKDFIATAEQLQFYSGKTPMRNLSWGCDRPKCEYRDLCIMDLQGSDTSMFIKLRYTKGDEVQDVRREEEDGDDD